MFLYTIQSFNSVGNSRRALKKKKEVSLRGETRLKSVLYTVTLNDFLIEKKKHFK